MDCAKILEALERERKFLTEFIRLSEEQRLLLRNEDEGDVNCLLGRRADLMMELTAIEATLETWISQIRMERYIRPEMMDELTAMNAEIVRMAGKIMEIDERTDHRIEAVKRKTRREPRRAANAKKAAKLHIV